MNSPDLTLDELESIVVSEVQLNVRLLRFMKSAYYGLPAKVDSIRKMLLFVGVKTLAAVATVLMMSQFSNKPAELIHIAMVRAKMCEMVGQRFGAMEADRFFTVGMLSLLDALLDLPMRNILEQLPLTEEVETVLLSPNSDSDLARALRIVMFYEAGDFEAVMEESFDLADADRMYRAANAWANATQKAIAA
jgi:EAL and modified HD-GYP domain-containing signal transduction protein